MTTTRHSARELLVRHAPLFVIAAVLVWHSLQYNFVTDDAFISFVYSRNFAEHGQLVFNLGEPVEGYTNFLWTFILGVLMFIGLPPEIMSLVLGTGFAIGTLFIARKIGERAFGGPSRYDLVAPALLALSAGFACWSSGGLETQMFTFFVTAALWVYLRDTDERRTMLVLGVLVALAAMTRPEGLLVAVGLLVHRVGANVVTRRKPFRSKRELWAVVSFMALWAPWFAWRWGYYGHAFPNTYYVKAAGATSAGYDGKMLQNGLYYVWQWARHSGALYGIPLALAGAFVAGARGRRLFVATLLVPFGVGYLAYAVKVGGDFMGLHRFVMPVFVVVAILVGFTARAAASRFTERNGKIGVAVATAAVIALFAVMQIRLTATSVSWKNWRADNGIDTPAYLAVYAHDRAVIGKHMRSCFADGDYSIFGGVGAKPYYARTAGIDVFGLVSDRIAHEVPRTNPRPGHNKWGPNSLLVEYDPTFVFSCYSLHRHPDKPKFNCAPGYWTRKGYEQVTLRIPGLLERGEYYSFLVKKDRAFECPGQIRR